MQLFAIIGRPGSDSADRRSVVELFLIKQFNRELTEKYLKIFDNYYNSHLQKLQKSPCPDKRTSSNSVRVLAICTQINKELTRRQKLIVLVNLLEFVKSGQNGITAQEMSFITTVAGIFNFPGNTLELIKDFIIHSFSNIPDSKHLLVIDGKKEPETSRAGHIYRKGLQGRVRVIRIPDIEIYLMRYAGENELYLNNQLILQNKVYVFDTGTSLRSRNFDPVYYSDITGSFSKAQEKPDIIFEAREIEYRFRGGATGLEKLSFSEKSGRLIGIMGSSGSGKTTLLNTLNGNMAPSSGKILINGTDIYSEKKKVEGLTGYVSQDDMLIEELTVYQNLYYNTKLCFGNSGEKEIKKKVNRLLQNLGLLEIKNLRVGSPLNKKISGGQRKRLNIALELIREPAVLFLDEPTSGLSSMDSENIMDLLKELALKGKLVFAVIHQPSSDIFKMFDRLLLLDTGGHLIYNGDPVDSIMYFKSCVQHANWNESECHVCGNVNPEQIFSIIETKVLDEFGRPTHLRKIPPSEWADRYRKRSSKEKKGENRTYGMLPEITFKIPGRLKQFFIFAKRDILSKLSNRQYILVNFLEPFLLALLLSYIIRYYNINVTNQAGYTFAGNTNVPVYIFMAVIVAIFTGLTVSAEEIIKDRKILKRESFLNLSRGSYLFSKTSILFGISALQAFLFVMAGNYIIEIEGMFFKYWLVLFSVWCFSNILGLIISDSFKTVITIYILIPFLVIPQLILSGVIVKFDDMNPDISPPNRIPFYGEVITSRWAYEALAVYQFKANPYESEFYPYNKTISKADYKRNFWIRDLMNKVDYCKRNIRGNDNSGNVKRHLRLLRNEIGKELSANPAVQYPCDLQKLTPENLTPQVLENAREYLNRLNSYYIERYNNASATRDRIINKYLETEEGRQNFMERKNSHHNEALSEQVRNAREIDRIVEYNGELHQKTDPIYREPEAMFIKAHFYAPVKNLLGRQYCTYSVNVAVIWFMTLMLWAALYYRLFKKGIDSLDILLASLTFSKTGEEKRL